MCVASLRTDLEAAGLLSHVEEIVDAAGGDWQATVAQDALPTEKWQRTLPGSEKARYTIIQCSSVPPCQKVTRDCACVV